MLGVQEPPEIPKGLLETYHGRFVDGYDDNDDYDDSDDNDQYDGDLKRARELLDDAPEGMQEKNFREVCVEMVTDPEPTVEPDLQIRSVYFGDVYFQSFQQSLEARAFCLNPLDFRKTRIKKHIDNLLNIYAFIRDFRLTALAGCIRTCVYYTLYTIHV